MCRSNPKVILYWKLCFSSRRFNYLTLLTFYFIIVYGVEHLHKHYKTFYTFLILGIKYVLIQFFFPTSAKKSYMFRQNTCKLQEMQVFVSAEYTAEWWIFLEHVSLSLGSLLKHKFFGLAHRVPDSGLGSELSMCIFNESPGDTDGEGPGIKLWKSGF